MVLDNADYLIQRCASFSDLNPLRVEEYSNIVYFNNDISSELVTRWSTMAESVILGRSMAHVVVMPHVNKVF